jgi:hypothetical protein
MEMESSVSSQKYIVHWESHQEHQKATGRQSTVPNRRWGHSLVLYRHYIYVFGGTISTNNYANSQAVYMFDLKNWNDANWERFLPGDTDTVPVPRDGHSATVLENSMYVFGGEKGGTLCKDLYEFDFRSLQCNVALIRESKEPDWRGNRTQGVACSSSLRNSVHHLPRGCPRQ